jgi:type III secretion system PrgH/EprH family protein
MQSATPAASRETGLSLPVVHAFMPRSGRRYADRKMAQAAQKTSQDFIMTLHFESESPDARAVLRLLNGPLSGCEYHLNGDTTLVVAGAASTLLGAMAHKEAAERPVFPESAIVVPMDGGSNFEIILDDNARDGFRLRTLAPQLEEYVRPYQEVCRVGTLAFAVRPADADWAPGIVDALPTAAEPEDVTPRQRSWLIRMLLGVIALFALLALGLALWMTLKDNQRVAEVAAVVTGSSGQYRLLKGSDGAIYIFADSERDVSWARQALTREGLIASARVSTLRDEELRLCKLLLESYPTLSFHRVKLANSARPVVVLSQERAHISSKERQALTASLATWMPYAESIGIATWSDAMLDEQARAGLDRLGIAYERVGNADSVTYTVQGSLNDIELARLQVFTDSFYRDFGTRYIYFSVALKDDWLKGKSFKYGGPGYVKMTQQHWFFPHTF